MADARIDPSALELKDRVVAINRVAKVVKGGRILGFATDRMFRWGIYTFAGRYSPTGG